MADPAEVDVVIVGAGPIGLAHAWGLKKLNPKLKIKILEKYQVYQRNHVLNMKPGPLEKLMQATGSMEDPVLAPLLAQLKVNPHIRTSKLQEAFQNVLKQFGPDGGVEFIYTEVGKERSVKDQIFQYRPKLVIGADGTHSITSKTLFSEDNQERRDFGYTLQMRYEVQGDVRPGNISSTIPFYQEMGRQGLIGAEHIGPLENGKTPVTLSLVISKKAFNELKVATSKKPIMPYSPDSPEANPTLSMNEVPERIQSFILNYWKHRLSALDKQAGEHTVDPKSIKISVNETPAAHAKQIFKEIEGTSIVLVGDSALSLSFFKGLNAGIEETAHLLAALKPVINRWDLQKPIQAVFRKHEQWMLRVFGPKKIREVAKFATWKVKAPETSVQLVRFIKYLSKPEYNRDPPELIKDYFDLLPIRSREKVRLYPHREYPLVKTNQIKEVPVKHSWIKIKKLFTDYGLPYKSWAQVAQDFKQPILGVANIGIGLLKIGSGLIFRKKQELKEGGMVFLRGLLEIITTPFAWTLKPIVRSFLTLKHKGFAKIEENTRTQQIVQQSLLKLAATSLESINKPETQHELSILAVDTHRKFQKAIRSGQPSLQAPLSEQARFNKMRDVMDNSDKQEWMKELKNYFSAFQLKETEIKSRKPKN